MESIPKYRRPVNAFVEADHCGNSAITDDLISLYLSGKKTAGSSLVADFNYHSDPIPKIGNYWIVLDSKNEPKLILKTIRLEFNLFGQIPDHIARAEAEGDCSVEDWQKIHKAFYEPYLEKFGIKDINQAQVVTEFFDLVFK